MCTRTCSVRYSMEGSTNFLFSIMMFVDVPIINDMNVDLSLCASLARSLVIRDLMSPVRRVEPDKTVNDG